MSVLLLYCTALCTYLRIFAPEDSLLRDSCSLFVSICDCSLICLAIAICLAFCGDNLFVYCHAIVIRLVFCNGNVLAFCGAIVIRLALRDGNLFVSWPVIVIPLLLCDTALLGCFGCLVADDCFPFAIVDLHVVVTRFLLCDTDLLGYFDHPVPDDCFLFAIADLFCNSDLLVVHLVKYICHRVVILVFLAIVLCP